MKAAVFASGSGTNFEALMEASQNGLLEADIKALVCDKEQAQVRSRARKYGVPERWYDPKAYSGKAAYEADILKWLAELEVEIIILAGYMRIVGSTLLEAYPDRIINLHPALLPAFPGAHAIADAYEAGVSETGVTVHYIDEKIDNGPIILQEPVAVDPAWTLEELEQAVHAKEYDLFYRGINQAVRDLQTSEVKEDPEKEELKN